MDLATPLLGAEIGTPYRIIDSNRCNQSGLVGVDDPDLDQPGVLKWTIQNPGVGRRTRLDLSTRTSPWLLPDRPSGMPEAALTGRGKLRGGGRARRLFLIALA